MSVQVYYKFISDNHTYNNIITQFIDEQEWYNIWSEHISNEMLISLKQIMPIECAYHLILTRKISLNNIWALLNNAYSMKWTTADIETFFSWYTLDEITLIINCHRDNHGVYYNYYVINYTLFIKGIFDKCHDSLLFKYMVDYVVINNIDIITIIQHMIINKYGIRYSKQIDYYIDMIKFNNSLRNIWLLAIMP